MLVQNFSQMVNTEINNATPYPTLKTKSGDTKTCTSGGGALKVSGLYAPNSLPTVTVAYNTATFCFGTSETETTANMNDLVSEIADYSGFTVVSSSKSLSTSGLGAKILLTQTLNYTGASDITINEIGYFQGVPFTSSDKRWVMFAREVLDSPITVRNGDTFTVSMAIG